MCLGRRTHNHVCHRRFNRFLVRLCCESGKNASIVFVVRAPLLRLSLWQRWAVDCVDMDQLTMVAFHQSAIEVMSMLWYRYHRRASCYYLSAFCTYSCLFNIRPSVFIRLCLNGGPSAAVKLRTNGVQVRSDVKVSKAPDVWKSLNAIYALLGSSLEPFT